MTLLSILAAGAALVWWTALRADAEMAKTINVDRLAGSREDLDNPLYWRIKDQLGAVRPLYPQCRFIYLMGRTPGGIVCFFADSEPESSGDYSPPGQIYEDVSAACLRVFDSGKAAVEGPVAVLGMDHSRT